MFVRFTLTIHNMTIKTPILNCKISEVAPRIYAVVIKDDYDRAMLFCRYQEFYESPLKGIRESSFTLFEFMRAYSRSRGNDVFTYTSDWSGFNIPSVSLKQAFKAFGKKYFSQYDEIMKQIFDFCEKDVCTKYGSKNKSFYLIGADSANSSTMRHEIAHGFYWTNPEYKKNCTELIKGVKRSVYETVKRVLVKIGYANDKNIIDDELQAYFSTGLGERLDGDNIRPYTKPFIENFKKFYKNKNSKF